MNEIYLQLIQYITRTNKTLKLMVVSIRSAKNIVYVTISLKWC